MSRGERVFAEDQTAVPDVKFGDKAIILFTSNDHALAATQLLSAVYQGKPSVQAATRATDYASRNNTLIALAQVHAILATIGDRS